MSPDSTQLSQEAVIELFRDCGALLEGHFLLSSGLHSPFYLQCARLLMEPRRAERVCAALRARMNERLPDLQFDLVASPAIGGIVFGYELARQFDRASLFAERVDGAFTLRRGFDLERGTRVLLAEDVITTGLSSRECMACVEQEGGEVVAAACLIDRSGGTAELGVPVVALAQLDLPLYPPDRVPAELAAQPAVKPGSRPQRRT